MQFKEFNCNYIFHKTLSPRLFIRNQLKKIITFSWHIFKEKKNKQIPQPCWYSVDRCIVFFGAMFISCPTVGMVRTANRRVQSGTRCSHPEWGHCKKKEMPGYTLRPYCSSYHKPQEKKLLYKCNNYIQSIFF